MVDINKTFLIGIVARTAYIFTDRLDYDIKHVQKGWLSDMIEITNFTYTFKRLYLHCPDLQLSRFIWNFFRLENEHLNNCGKFRAVRDISVAPVDCSDQTHILRMMDATDGVVNRKRKQKLADKGKPSRTLSKGESLNCDLSI